MAHPHDPAHTAADKLTIVEVNQFKPLAGILSATGYGMEKRKRNLRMSEMYPVRDTRTYLERGSKFGRQTSVALLAGKRGKFGLVGVWIGVMICCTDYHFFLFCATTKLEYFRFLPLKQNCFLQGKSAQVLVFSSSFNTRPKMAPSTR